MRLEEFVGSVEQELERQEYFHVGSFLQKAFVHDFSVFQLIHANGVGPGAVADGVQRVHYLWNETDVRKQHVLGAFLRLVQRGRRSLTTPCGKPTSYVGALDFGWYGPLAYLSIPNCCTRLLPHSPRPRA